MKKIKPVKSLKDLQEIKNRMMESINPTEPGSVRVVVGLATCGVAAGAQPVYEKILELVKEQKLDKVHVVPTGCVGICQFEPVVEIYSEGKRTTYVRMTPEKAERVVQQHLRGGNPVAEYTIGARR